jgi:SPP1 family holin
MSRKTSSIIRGVLLTLAVINQILAAFEAIPMSEDTQVWYQFASTVFTAITGAVSYWYNNSFTENAQKADKYLDILNSGAQIEGDEE